jgi:hypothetical protein
MRDQEVFRALTLVQRAAIQIQCLNDLPLGINNLGIDRFLL